MIAPAEVRTAALFNATDRCAGRATVLVVLRDGGNLAFVPAMPTQGARERRVRGTGVDR